MKLAKTLLATTLALTAASTFAASNHDKVHAPAEDKVVVSTQEQANTANAASEAVGSASEAAPAAQ
ncbi:MAG TPA: hypothetical protein DEA77_13590 [Acinetobacter nosocomialis]|nr:hypothetical protein [Acinetobacter nosocomialis]